MSDKVKIAILRNDEGSWEGVYDAERKLITEDHSADIVEVLKALGFEPVIIYRSAAWFKAHGGDCPPVLNADADKIPALLVKREEYAEAEIVAQERRREVEAELRELGVKL